MLGVARGRFECPHCGYTEPSNDALPPEIFFRPWHLRGRSSVKKYVASLSAETREWLLALYVDHELNLLAVETVARGDIAGCQVNFARVLWRGHELKASGFLLVHNHPSGDPTPSMDDIRTTVRLRQTSEDMDLPLLDHLIIAADEMSSVGGF